MKFSELKLPSNKKFGFFFTFVFLFAASYFFLSESIITAYIFFSLAVSFLLITFINANALLFLNKLWMGLGFILGLVIQPIILGLIFFGIFTPIAFVMRVFGRDELRLKLNDTSTFWKNRVEDFSLPDTFKNQF